MLSLLWARVWSLVEELRSHKPQGMAKKIKSVTRILNCDGDQEVLPLAYWIFYWKSLIKQQAVSSCAKPFVVMSFPSPLSFYVFPHTPLTPTLLTCIPIPVSLSAPPSGCFKVFHEVAVKPGLYHLKAWLGLLSRRFAGWLLAGWNLSSLPCGLSTGIPGYSQDMAAGYPRVSDPREIEGKI